MAQIVLSDIAPSDAKHFSLANENFDVPYETDDSVVIGNALAHPWLDVNFPKVEVVEGDDLSTSVAPADDPLSGSHSLANDPDAVRAALVEANASDPVAIDAGLDQNKPVEVDGVAVTLAADEDTDTASKPKRSTAKKEN